MKNAINCIRDILEYSIAAVLDNEIFFKDLAKDLKKYDEAELQYVCNLMHEAELIRCVRKNLKEYHTIKIIRIRQVTLL